jgi:hypothetical protein
VTAEKGPVMFCDRHAQNFKPEFNKNASDGEFYWGAEADEKFKTIGPKPNGVNR